MGKKSQQHKKASREADSATAGRTPTGPPASPGADTLQPNARMELPKSKCPVSRANPTRRDGQNHTNCNEPPRLPYDGEAMGENAILSNSVNTDFVDKYRQQQCKNNSNSKLNHLSKTPTNVNEAHSKNEPQCETMTGTGACSTSISSKGVKNPNLSIASRPTNSSKGYMCKPNHQVLLMFGVCVILSLGTRLYKIEWPPHICWDETHFGKMGSWYINGTFFFDVHPPLGKMLIAMAGSLTGYNGSFGFTKPSVKYDDVPYIGMRAFCACLGAALGPLCFGCAWELTHSPGAAVLSGSLVIFDTGLLTLSQYILLDPLLLFFIMSATYCLLRFLNQHHRPFRLSWWLWLMMTGCFLACSIGVKFVGLFIILLTGFSTAMDLWRLLGNLSLTMIDWLRHLCARAVCLIVLPIMLYLLFFAIHFNRLYKSGSGDGFYSSAFQSQLQGNPLYNANMPAEVAYGSVVTLKNHRTGGAYLHSHLHLYPEGKGARQQQVTTYGHKDENNRWMIKKFNSRPDPEEEPELLMNGDRVRLEHVSTRRNLHSHRIPAPLTPKYFQVTCYGNDGEGDYNDVFRLEIVGVKGHAPLHTVRSVFRLIHTSIGCALHSHNKQLPKWGWEQMEVTCNPNMHDKRNLWNIEEVIDSRLPNRSFTVYAPSFLEKVIESHAVMTQGNSDLKPKEGEVTSRPWQWLVNYRGQRFSGGNERVYLLGNPVIWWGSLAAMVIFMLLYAYHAIRRQRGTQEDQAVRAYRERTFRVCGWLMLGWLLHYAPFWTMGRVLYFHHYFPAVLYSFMLTGILVDYVIVTITSLFRDGVAWSVYHFLFGVVLSGIVYSFYLFRHLSYGMSGPLAPEKGSEMYGLRWLESWEI